MQCSEVAGFLKCRRLLKNLVYAGRGGCVLGHILEQVVPETKVKITAGTDTNAHHRIVAPARR